MASGCTSSNTSITSFGDKIADTKVKYTGPAIPSLGICTNDLLSEIEAIILNKIVDFSQGIGILIPDIDLSACKLFTTYITCCNGSSTVPKELDDLMKIIFDALCALDTRLTIVEDYITDLNAGPYNTSCIPALVGVTNPTLRQILQALMNDYCNLKTQVNNIQTQLNNLITNLSTTIGNQILSAINSCQSGSLVKIGAGHTANIQLSGFVPIGGVIPYHGPMTAFDSTGKGYTGSPACGWALANGNNGTTDYKGFVFVGTTTMGGTVLSSITSGATYNLDDVGGEIRHKLLSGESGVPPGGGLSINDPGHDHVLFYKSRKMKKSGTGTDNYADFTGPLGDNTGALAPFNPATGTGGYSGGGSGVATTAYISKSPTGITATFTPSDAPVPHENRMPYKAVNYIQRIA